MFAQRIWRALQLHRYGVYSLTRQGQLWEYQQRTPMLRAVGVCVLTPLPSLGYAVAIEAVPLAPISAGLEASFPLFLRVCAVTTTIAFGGICVMRRFIAGMEVGRWQLVVPAVATGVVHTGAVALYSWLWVFPIPFATAQTSSLFLAIAMASFVAINGTRPFATVPDAATKVRLVVTMLVLIISATYVYPAFGVLFRSVHGALQFLVFALPIAFKMAVKGAIATLCRKLERQEFIPEVAHFGVEVAHSLFVMTCLQTAIAPVQTVVMVVLSDFLPLIGAYRTVRRLMEGRVAQRRGPTSILPAPLVAAEVPVPLPTLKRQASLDRALFALENHLLVEYIECAIPLVYGVYVAVLFYLPNAKYYDVMQPLQTDVQLVAFLARILLLVTLQGGSVVVFSGMVARLDRSRRVSCLHVLSFVLETQAGMVQTWLFIWVPFCVLSMVQQAGNDFTLQFEWVRKAT